MPGFANDAAGNSIMWSDNVDFSGNVIPSRAITADGQLLIGATAAPNIRPNTLTAGAGVTITNGPGTITIGLIGGAVAIETLTGNSGGAISPTGNNINTLGTGSITIAGAGSTLTTQLTGLTLNAIQVGAGTATLTQLGPTNRAVLTSDATGVPTMTALAVDGQLIIGSTAGAPAAATLTAGTGITITNASNSITIAATNVVITWTDVTTATQALLVLNGYVTDRGAGVTYTLPATAALGDEIKIVGKLGLTTIAQNAGQQILISSASSTVGVGGSVAGTNVGDCIDLICITSGASTIWRAIGLVGNWTVT